MKVTYYFDKEGIIVESKEFTFFVTEILDTKTLMPVPFKKFKKHLENKRKRAAKHIPK